MYYVVAEVGGCNPIISTVGSSIEESWGLFKDEFFTDNHDYNIELEQGYSVFEVDIKIVKEV